MGETWNLRNTLHQEVKLVGIKREDGNVSYSHMTLVTAGCSRWENIIDCLLYPAIRVLVFQIKYTEHGLTFPVN